MGVLGFSLLPLWCYPLHLYHCLNECEASWLWDFGFSPHLLSLSGLVVVSLVTKKNTVRQKLRKKKSFQRQRVSASFFVLELDSPAEGINGFSASAPLSL